MEEIMKPYPNAIIIGDMNDGGNYKPLIHMNYNSESATAAETAAYEENEQKRFDILKAVFIDNNDSGWHIANIDFDQTPTHDFGLVYAGTSAPLAGKV